MFCFELNAICPFLVLLVFGAYLLHCGQPLEVQIDLSSGQDVEDCLSENSNLSRPLPCRTLEYIADNIGQHNSSNLTILIKTTRVSVRREVNFVSYTNLTIIGSDPLISVRCRRSASTSVGFRFIDVHGLQIRNIFFRDCQARFRVSSAAAFQVRDCVDVSFENVHFFRSRATAVVFIDTFGRVLLNNSSFVNNALYDQSQQIYSYPGGIAIEFAKNYENSLYMLDNCSFIDNTAPDQFIAHGPNLAIVGGNWSGQSLGGGIGVLFVNNASNINITIINSNFTDNTALWGGAIYVQYEDRAMNNSVSIQNSWFERNRAVRQGGGINFGFLQRSPHGNKLLVFNCTFIRNAAVVGGGTSVFGVHTNKPLSNNSVLFNNCTWSMNQARSSAAVDVSPAYLDRLNQGFLPTPVFKDCSFLSNTLSVARTVIESFLKLQRTGQVVSGRISTPTLYSYSGVFTVTRTAVRFGGKTVFKSNNYTAMRITSSKIFFEPNSQVHFCNNYGTRGGALSMYGFSSLVFYDDSSFVFINNTAEDVGGAMYYETFDQQDFTFGRRCFLQYYKERTNTSIENRNVTFTFDLNFAQYGGSSIYSSSFYPCFFEWFDSISSNNVTDLFGQLADFTFDENASLASNGRVFHLDRDENEPFATIPGKSLTIPFSLLDEFDQKRRTLFALGTITDTEISLDRTHTLETNTRFFGKPLQNFTFLVSAQRVTDVSFGTSVSMLPCPPGFYFASDRMSCRCAAENSSYAYIGMTRCNNSVYQAFVAHGFWAGYDISKKQLYTALCPLTFCALTTRSTRSQHAYALPNSCSELTRAMCGNDRHGVLCSQCQDNLSVYYHSRQFKCGSNKLCSVGFVFYILSEILPTIILFGVIITFNVSFTSGYLNGIIFFSQVLDTLTLNTRLFDKHIANLKSIFNVFYGVLNFDFFNIETLSFCLWKGATIMDILAFKYVTVIFALFLVIGIILLMNSRFCSKVPRKVSTKISVMHGLSAFLVICYTQCTKISFYVLTRVVLKGSGGIGGPHVTFFGGIPYFGGKHLVFAIPAIVCLVAITIVPPLLLFGYPLVCQLLNIFHLSEHCIVNKLSVVFPLHKLMPLFDTFQSCFKDRLRFFAGLYFIYRVAILASYSISRSVTQFYIASEFFLVLILGLHSTVHPYKKVLHNSIDSLLFLNLVLINGLTLVSETYAADLQEHPTNFNTMTALIVISLLQLILISLPSICVVSWFLWKLVKKVKYIRCFKKGKESLLESINVDDLTQRELDDSDYHYVNESNEGISSRDRETRTTFISYW